MPDQLIDEYRQNLEELNLLSKSISSLPNIKQDRNEINVFEGTHGFQLAFDQHMKNLKENEPLAIVAFGSNAIDAASFKKVGDIFLKVNTYSQAIIF